MTPKLSINNKILALQGIKMESYIVFTDHITLIESVTNLSHCKVQLITGREIELKIAPKELLKLITSALPQ